MKLNPKNNFFAIIAIFAVLPLLLPIITSDPIVLMIANIGIILGFLYLIKSRMKGISSALLGSKITWMCMACAKVHNQGSCPRCGSKMRKPT